jgi:site-specific DNA recombinase
VTRSAPSSLRRPVADVDQAVIDYLVRNVITEDVITDALNVLRRRLTDRTKCTTTEVQVMEADAKRLKAEIDNLVAAVAAGASQVDALVQGLAERQEKLSEVDACIRAAKTAPEAISMELRRIERDARARLDGVPRRTRGAPSQARAFLTQILAGPLKFTPQKNRYRVDGKVSAVTDVFSSMPNVASPRGFEPLYQG